MQITPASMTGAESLLRSASASGVRVCFANPGTSEMHFVAALDNVPGIRPVLGLFEGGVTGMADGYGRATGIPAMTLLHLGTGYSNGIANLHNARRARSPIVNVVGEHASYHTRWDSPLKTELAALARPMSDWLRTSSSAHSVAADIALAIAAARETPNAVATLILPADAAWGMTTGFALPIPPRPPTPIDPDRIARVAAILMARGPQCVLLVRESVACRAGLDVVARICARTGARPLADLVAPRMLRGRGMFAVPRIPYRAETVVDNFTGLTDLVLAGTHPPVAPFAYPSFPSWCTPDDVVVTYLSHEHEDEVATLEALARYLGSPHELRIDAVLPPQDRPRGTLTAATIGRSIALHLPEGAIVSEEAISNAGPILAAMSAAPPHLEFPLTGGAIGQGVPLATGAAVGAPDRKILNIQADGSAMYTLQALWTQARENLDVITVVLANRSYGVLKAEVERVGAHIGNSRAGALLELGNPDLDFVALANGLGVEASRALTAEAFDDQLRSAMASRGPRLIEAVIA